MEGLTYICIPCGSEDEVRLLHNLFLRHQRVQQLHQQIDWLSEFQTTLKDMAWALRSVRLMEFSPVLFSTEEELWRLANGLQSVIRERQRLYETLLEQLWWQTYAYLVFKDCGIFG